MTAKEVDMKPTVIAIVVGGVMFAVYFFLMWPAVRKSGVESWTQCVLPSATMAAVWAFFVWWAFR